MYGFIFGALYITRIPRYFGSGRQFRLKLHVGGLNPRIPVLATFVIVKLIIDDKSETA